MWREPSIKMRKHLQGCKIEHPQVALSMLELDRIESLSSAGGIFGHPAVGEVPIVVTPKFT